MVIRHRKPNRLKNFDYSSSGYYFITICTKDRQKYFGNITNDKMVLNEYGNITKQCWNNIVKHFENIELDEFQIMPNHIHGIIIVIYDDKNPVGNRHACSLHCEINRRQNQLIPNIINLFKSTTSKLIHQSGIDSFRWQKSFYDHIVRSEYLLFRIRQYIRDNPENWETERNNLINNSSLDRL